jgi:uncharacterized membrane protein
MIGSKPQSTTSIAGHSIHPMVILFPIACFVGLGHHYHQQSSRQDHVVAICCLACCRWSHGWRPLATPAGLTDLLGKRAIPAQGHAWSHAIGNMLVLGLSLTNACVHSRDAWTSVVPAELIRSAVLVVILLLTGWID